MVLVAMLGRSIFLPIVIVFREVGRVRCRRVGRTHIFLTVSLGEGRIGKTASRFEE